MRNLIGLALCYFAAIFFLVPLLYKLYQRAEKKKGQTEAQSFPSSPKEGRAKVKKLIGNLPVQKGIIRGLGWIAVKMGQKRQNYLFNKL